MHRLRPLPLTRLHHPRPLHSVASHHPLPVLPTSLDAQSPAALQRADDMRAAEAAFTGMLRRHHASGGEKAQARARGAGKLLVRERIDRLLDPFSPFLELSPTAGEGMYGKDLIASGGVVAGIGRVAGQEVMVVANDATVKGGSYHPITVKKHLRAQEIAAQNRLPCVYLVESGGAALPFQADVFPDANHFGRIFYNMARMSQQGIRQVAVVHGISVAGGAYVPAMADENIIVANQGSIFLAGPPLVKAALGEDVDSETLGGGAMHARESGVVDHLATSDEHALYLARQAIASFSSPSPSPSPASRAEKTPDPPLYDPRELGAVTGTNLRKGWDAREVVARVVDGSRFAEWKKEWGDTVVVGWGEVHGHKVGIIANNGVLLSPSALKATQFIQLCEQQDTPLVFLTNISGFMVGKEAEKGGIAKNGAKLVRAVAATTVPKITINVGGSYGAGNYGMCGRAYSPHFLFSWPSARVAVMGPDQLHSVMQTVSSDPAKTEKLREQIERESRVEFGSARLWDDGIILPSETRTVLGLALGVIAQGRKLKRDNEARGERGNFGVFRM
ncbi:hypothetical protein JCM10207_007113 [Rhodosporidiobolus poonsookiae]